MYFSKRSDKSLVAAILQGGGESDKAQAYLYDELKLEKLGRAKARHLKVPQHEVLDFVHGAFILLLQKIKEGSFQTERGSIKAYFLAVLERQIKNSRGKELHRQSLLQEKQSIVGTPDFMASSAMEKEDFEKRALEIFGQLGELCRKILLYSYHEYKPRQIAGLLGWGNDEGQRVSQKKRTCRENLRRGFPVFFEELVQLRKNASHEN